MKKVTFPSAIHEGVIRNKNRVQRRKRVRAMMLAGEWERIGLEYNFTPRFTPVVNGKKVFDWKSLPWDLRDVLLCGRIVKETPYTQAGGIFDPKEKPKHSFPNKPQLLWSGARAVPIPLIDRANIRDRLYESQKALCYYCNLFIGNRRQWTIEHKIPISRGGTNEESNLVGACSDCNSNKSWMTHDEFLASGFITLKLSRNKST